MIYAFDVDETLSCSGGPIRDEWLWELARHNVVGINGNWAVFVQAHPATWSEAVSFIGPIGLTKADFLRQLGRYIPCDGGVMVGNDPSRGEASDDIGAAKEAGWPFVHASDFAEHWPDPLAALRGRV